MKVWITKYALTQGIIEADCKRLYEDGWGTLLWIDKKGFKHNDFMPPHSFTLNKYDAIARGEEMRKKKIANLKKQIEKLEKLKFK